MAPHWRDRLGPSFGETDISSRFSLKGNIMDDKLYANVPADSIVAGDRVRFVNSDKLVVEEVTRNFLGEVVLFLFSEATRTRVVTITSADTIFCKLRKAN